MSMLILSSSFSFFVVDVVVHLLRLLHFCYKTIPSPGPLSQLNEA